jgi:hypothetical protein
MTRNYGNPLHRIAGFDEGADCQDRGASPGSALLRWSRFFSLPFSPSAAVVRLCCGRRCPVSPAVHVQVKEGRDLPPADSNGLADPFFWIFYNNANRKESPVLYKTLTPKWDVSFE